MDTLADFGVELLVIAPAAVVALVVLIRRGALRREALRQAPPRRPGLTGFDLAITVALVLLPVLLVGFQDLINGTTPPAVDDPSAAAPTLRFAGNMLLGQLLLFLLPVSYLVIRVAPRGDGLRELGLVPRNPVAEVQTAGLALLAIVPLSMGATVLTVAASTIVTGEPPPQVGHETLVQLLHAVERRDVAVVLLLLLSAVVVAPLLEELVFRGMVQSALLGALGLDRRWTVVFLAAAVFTLVHVSPASIQWQTLPGLFVLAVALGWLYERTGSLLPPVLVHVGFNLINVALALVI